MTSRPISSNGMEKRDQDNKNSPNCTGTKPKIKFPGPQTLNSAENNAYNNSSQSDSSTSSVTFGKRSLLKTL